MKLDTWQQQVLDTKGNIALRSGRQVGKSTIIAIKAGEYAAKHAKKTIMVISAVERQALLLFEKILSYIHLHYKSFIKTGKDKPTKHKIQLKNGSIIHCLPTGESGYGIRGFTISMLIADEAAFISEDVWQAVTPMLAVTKGSIILLSTPFGREGYFARCFKDPTFKNFHISSLECERIDKEFLAQEKTRMSKLQFQQEYLGEFVDNLMQLFPDSLIKASQSLKKGSVALDRVYLGVDVARMGGDDSTFEIVEKRGDMLYQRDNIITTDTLTTETTKLIITLENKWHFRRIYIDDGGMGVGVFDQLLNSPETKRKVVPINNARRSQDNEDKRFKKLLKEDLYNNLLRLMEQGKIKLLDDPEIFLSLKSIQYEYVTKEGQPTRLRIFGNYSHIAEGLIRAAWCTNDKSLSPYIF